jgi:hypothetical protein
MADMFEEINSADDAVEVLGGTTAVARLFGVDLRVVSNWRERGLPPDTYSGFKKLFEERGINMPPPSLWRHRELAPSLDAGIPTDSPSEAGE